LWRAIFDFQPRTHFLSFLNHEFLSKFLHILSLSILNLDFQPAVCLTTLAKGTTLNPSPQEVILSAGVLAGRCISVCERGRVVFGVRLSVVIDTRRGRFGGLISGGVHQSFVEHRVTRLSVLWWL